MITVTTTSYTDLVKDLAKEYIDYPTTISIETKSHCNADCSFCPYSSLDRKGTVLPDRIIDKICTEISQFPKERKLNIVLARVNETFLDKRWLEIANKLLTAKSNITFGFFSNGSTLSNKIIQQLVTLKNVEYLNVSLNYSDPDEHAENMKLNFHKVIENMDRLHTLVENGEFKPLVVVSRVGTGDHKDKEFRDFVAKKFPKFRIKVASKSDWLGNVEVTGDFDIPSEPCRQWFQLHILADGKQAYCCIDSSGDHGFGNIEDNSLLELYNHPELRRTRQLLPARTSVSTCSDCVLMA